MSENLMQTCELFIRNRELLMDNFKLEGSEPCNMAAVLLTGKGKLADIGRLKECERILKENSSMFSAFRGNAKLALLVAMADKAADEAGIREYVDASDAVFEAMKRNHPVNTDVGDYAMAALIALTSQDGKAVVDKAEEIYACLNNDIGKGSLRNLSIVLAMSGGDAAELSRKAADLYNALKAADVKISLDAEAPIIGALAALDIPVQDIVAEVRDADAYLHEQKGFHGLLGLGGGTRHMYAALLVIDAHQQSDVSDTVAEVAMLTAAMVSQFVALYICCIQPMMMT